MQPGDRETRPLRAEVLSPRRLAFADRQMTGCNVAFDPNLMTQTVGNPTCAILHDPRDIEFGKSGGSHAPIMLTVIGGRLRYPVAQEPSTRSYRRRGLSQSSTRQGRSLSLAEIVSKSS
ncbi:hypothetical protein BH09ACT9_BH09ACT9_50250 [soil metagenome]